MSLDLDLPYVALIPYNVQADRSLSDAAKIYFGQLAGLAKKHGYCWATDEQLAKMKTTSIKNIERWHLELEKAGHIFRDTESISILGEDGKHHWIRKRKLFVNDGFSKKVSDTPKNEGTIEPLKNEGIIEPLKNEGYKEVTLINNSKEALSSCPKDAPPSESPAASAAPRLKKEVSQEDLKNTQALIERLRVLKPDVKIPAAHKKWHNQMRLLREVDKRSSDQIIRVINWLGGADCLFEVWSPESLRQKFDKIEHRMKNPIKKFNQQIDRSSKDEYGNTLTPEFIRATYGF